MIPLAQMAVEVLGTADGRAKTALSHRHAAAWRAAREGDGRPVVGQAEPPQTPARPAAPALLDPREMPRRKPGSPQGRIAMLHAVAHIELNAVDLHWDIIARFSDTAMPIGFFDDWVKAADEESKHFNLMCDCLEAEGSFYGALPAHAGMWRAAEDTAEDLMGRLAVVPMVLEARGLDVTPSTVARFRAVGDETSAKILSRIYNDEIRHVRAGTDWFGWKCDERGFNVVETWHALVKSRFRGALKPPFNDSARHDAGLTQEFYAVIAS
ncbi:MAG: ferritin-like domain-containing protein [Alphaproteobacteria bacterium]|nr:ferritin-like domain-containing protein [Alphaproteobacteria bacterium]